MLEDENLRDTQILDLLGLTRHADPTAEHGARLFIALTALRTSCLYNNQKFEDRSLEYLSSIGRDVKYTIGCLYLYRNLLDALLRDAANSGDVATCSTIEESMENCLVFMDILDN